MMGTQSRNTGPRRDTLDAPEFHVRWEASVLGFHPHFVLSSILKKACPLSMLIELIPLPFPMESDGNDQ